jgi:hypothetical protein
VLHMLLESYEHEWMCDGYNMSMAHMCSCMFLLVSCLGGMRGFEVMWTDLAALRYDLFYCEDKRRHFSYFLACCWKFQGS